MKPVGAYARPHDLVPFAVLGIVERQTFGCDLIRMINVAASRVASGDFFFHRHFPRSLFQPTPHPPTLSHTLSCSSDLLFLLAALIVNLKKLFILKACHDL